MAQKITSILDKGYHISLKSDALRIHFLFIEKPNQNGTMSTKSQMVYLKALDCFEALNLGFKLFDETLGDGKGFAYEDYFGPGKIDLPLVSPLNHHSSLLDKMLSQSTTLVELEKSKEEKYKLTVRAEHIIGPNQKLFEISFNQLSDE